MLKAFKTFLHNALGFAFDLYTIMGGIAILLIVYGFLWMIIALVWKKVHKQSHDAFVNMILGLIGKKLEEPKKEEENGK